MTAFATTAPAVTAGGHAQPGETATSSADAPAPTVLHGSRRDAAWRRPLIAHFAIAFAAALLLLAATRGRLGYASRG
jgi:hypothetical protein